MDGCYLYDEKLTNNFLKIILGQVNLIWLFIFLFRVHSLYVFCFVFVFLRFYVTQMLFYIIIWRFLVQKPILNDNLFLKNKNKIQGRWLLKNERERKLNNGKFQSWMLGVILDLKRTRTKNRKKKFKRKIESEQNYFSI